MTQVTEKHFRESMLKNPNVLHIEKIQVNPNAMTNTDSDFFLQTQMLDYKIECKEVKCFDRKTKPIFRLSRFTQCFRLNKWQLCLKRNFGCLFLCFWHGRKKSSSAFLIPVLSYIDWQKGYKKSSITEEQANLFFAKYKMDSNWDLLTEVIL